LRCEAKCGQLRNIYFLLNSTELFICNCCEKEPDPKIEKERNY